MKGQRPALRCLELWLDIDEDSAITGDDLAPVTHTYPSYLFVY